MTPARGLAIPGDTCWRRERAARVAFLVDGASYFAALRGALERAQRRVLVLGWDFDGRTRLRPDAPAGELPDELGPLLDSLVRARPELRVHVLEWDYSVLYAVERGIVRFADVGWCSHERFAFELDDRHPFGASHHQKLVAIDDSLAFAGGFDLCLRRWDTSEHRAGDPARVDPGGRPYDSFHDVQIAVDGAAARALAELAAERWRRVTGDSLAPLGESFDPWPGDLAPDARHCEVAIARTEPAWGACPGVREVQKLLLAAIGAARRALYLESQYFTAPCVAEALAARLRERAGPEVVLVLPARCSGWIEESTMGRLRVDLVRALRAADRFGRLRVLAPIVPPERPLNVHSKLCIADESLVRVGSSNLSARSMGFDSECDLALESDGRADLEAAICGLRARLLGEHLGVSSADFEAARLAAGGSVIRAIDSLNGGARRLEPIESCEAPVAADWMRSVPIDPEAPPLSPLARRIALGVGLVLALGSACAALVRR